MFRPSGAHRYFWGIIISTNVSPLWGFFDRIINYGALGFHNCGCPANPANGANVSYPANVSCSVKRSEPQSGDILVEKDRKKNKAPEERHMINL